MYVITVPNLLEPEKSFKTEHEHTSVIDYLQFQYPDGFKVPHVIYRNNNKIEVEDYDLAMGRDDYIVIAFSPAAPLLAIAAPYLIKFAIAAAASYIIGEIFKPDIPSGALSSGAKTENSNVSSVYNLSSGQNRAALGRPIPSLYGRVRVYPNLIEQPYYRFSDNELYLYQMMAISVGDMAIEELLIVDTPETDLAPNDLLSRTFRSDQFDAGEIKTVISTEFSDDAYHMRVKTLQEVSSLELRGTPSSSFSLGSFSGSVITFHQYSNGLYPDLTSLVNGSFITITNSDSNDGVYTVDSVDLPNYAVTVQAHTFTTEPTIINISSTASMVSGNTEIAETLGTTNIYDNSVIGQYYDITVSGTTYNAFIPTSKRELGGLRTTFNKTMPISGDSVAITLTKNSSMFDAEFKTSYGAYTLEDVPSTLDSIEVDVEFPRGIYNSNATTGAFEDRTILLEYKLIGSLETLWLDLNDNGETYTEIEKTNNPQRRTYKLPIPAGLTDDIPLKIRLRRSSAEVEDTRSQDQAIVTRIKSIYDEPDINDYGDITLLWVRAKASNAISSAGQFQINAWVNRQDVSSDLTSVITDIYTNTEYGAGLNTSDLDLPAMNAPQYNVITFDTGFLEVNTTLGEETYYGEDTSGLACPPGSVKTAIFFNGVNVFGSECIDEVILEGSYIPNNEYLAPDGWHYMIEEYIEFIDFAYTKVRVRRYKLVDIIDPNYVEFNGAIDSKITVMDALRMVGKAGRYTVYLDGQNVKMRKDEVQLIRTALYNETNILKDSFKLDYLFGEDDGFDGTSVKYRDPIDFKEAIATYPDTASNPEVTELIGCTDFQIALAEATYGWLQKESRRKVVSFSTDIQGILPNYLDRVGVTHNTPDWGLSSNIVAVSGNQITINCQLFGSDEELGICTDELGLCADIFCKGYSENLDFDTIIFRNKDGSVSELFSFTIIGRYDIILDSTPPAWLYTGSDYDRTFFSIGVSNKFVKDYIVTEITPRGNNVVDVKAVNYDPTVYVQPVLVDGFGLELTDGDGNLLN